MIAARLALGGLLCASLAIPQTLQQQALEGQRSGDYRKAERAYSQLLEQDPDNPRLLVNLGLMLHLQGRAADALPRLLAALEIEPGLGRASLFAGLSLLQLGRHGEAVSHLEKALDADRDDALAILGLARAYLAAGDVRRANDFYHRLAARDGTNSEAWFGLGITYRRLLDSVAARLSRTSASGALRTTGADRGSALPDRAALRLAEGRVLERPSDPAALAALLPMYSALALDALRNATRLAPDSPRAHLLLAESYRESGDLAAALESHRRAIEIEPSPAAFLGLATTYWKGGDHHGATEPLERVLTLAPDDAQANALMADILSRRGDFEQAERHAKRAVRSGERQPLISYVWARIHMAKDRPERAVDAIRGVLDADPDGSYHYLMFRALKRLDRNDEAAAALRGYQQIRAASR